MKKIALLLTLLCAGALNGMEQPEQGHYVGIGMENLPDDVKPIIITYLNQYNNLDDTIYAIKAVSLTNKSLNKMINEKYGNLKGFTALVHMLAAKFPIIFMGKEDSRGFRSGYTSSPGKIANLFNTPTAKEYVNLGTTLLEAVKNNDINRITQLIKQGADVHYYHNDCISPLIQATYYGNAEIVKLLLDSGVNPNFNHNDTGIALEYIKRDKPEAETIEQLLKAAMEN